MSDQLVIRLAETGLNAQQQVDWNLYNEAGDLQHSGNSALANLYEQVASQSEQFDISVIVPGESVLLTSTQIPSKQIRQIKQALPFMVEELIADDIESVHIAIPPVLNNNSNLIDVAIVSHRVMVDWLDELHSNQLSPNQLLIDVLCLPGAENCITLLLDHDNILIRGGDYSGMVVQRDDFQLIFESLLDTWHSIEDMSPKPSISLIYTSQQNIEMGKELSASLHSHYPDYEIKASQYNERILEIIADTACIQKQPTINLLQGGYAVNKTHENPWVRWRLAASIAFFGVCIYLLSTLSMGWYFQYQANKIDEQSVKLYKQLFPNERRIVSPKKQMENHLRLQGGSNNSHFLQLLADTALQLSTDQPQQLLVEALRFDSNLGDLVFQVQSPSIEKLDEMKQLLAQQGLAVDINSATEQDDHVVGRFAVRRL